jgi:hypothetical protein
MCLKTLAPMSGIALASPAAKLVSGGGIAGMVYRAASKNAKKREEAVRAAAQTDRLRMTPPDWGGWSPQSSMLGRSLIE